jgi:hypothetical protein
MAEKRKTRVIFNKRGKDVSKVTKTQRNLIEAEREFEKATGKKSSHYRDTLRDIAHLEMSKKEGTAIPKFKKRRKWPKSGK